MLKGTIEGGFENLFSLAFVGCSLNNIWYIPSMSKLPKETSKVDLNDVIHQPSLELVEETRDSQALLEHLLTSFQIVYGKH